MFTAKNVHAYAAVLGALKAGACWVPLNTAFPQERLRHLLTVLQPLAIIADESTIATTRTALEQMPAASPLILLGSNDARGSATFDQRAVDAQSRERPSLRDLTAEDLAYIIFTSGSTGVPKGVMVRHRNTSEFLSLCRSFFDIAPGSRFAHFSDLTFDPSIFDMFHCWQTRGTLVPANRRAYRIDPARFLIDQRINVLFAVPTMLASVRDSGQLQNAALASVRHLLLTGEPAPPQLVRDWYAAHPETTIYNMYGPTETSIVSHWCRIPRALPRQDSVPVGTPLPGMRVTLLDGDQPVASGGVGESFVCGSQVSAGYWADPLQTEKAFVSDPVGGNPHVKAYRTGDLLRQEGGLYYYVGRVDSQVKVRGHRVELGEVENTLLANDAVRKAAVVFVERPGTPSCLVAFVDVDSDVSPAALRDYLVQRLPTYMVPGLIVPKAGDMPTGATGKIDRGALRTLAAEMLKRTRDVTDVE